MSAGAHNVFFLKLLLFKEGIKKLKNWARDRHQSFTASKGRSQESESAHKLQTFFRVQSTLHSAQKPF